MGLYLCLKEGVCYQSESSPPVISINMSWLAISIFLTENQSQKNKRAEMIWSRTVQATDSIIQILQNEPV